MMTISLRQTTFYILLIIFSVLFSECKRHRKINVEGVVTDKYTGQPIPNLRVSLSSSIKTVDKYTSDSRLYYEYSNSEGKFYFTDAYFSKPNFSGYTIISDENGIYGGRKSEEINIKDAKLIGKTKLTRNLEGLCYANLNLTFNISNYNWYITRVRQKFIGSRYIDEYSTFEMSGPTSIGYWENKTKQTAMLGYPDGKIILKTELFTSQEVVLATKYDTITPTGCGTTYNYTITVN